MGSVRHCFPSMDKIWLMSMEPSPSAGKGAPSGNISFIMAAIVPVMQIEAGGGGGRDPRKRRRKRNDDDPDDD